jgi:hypothetical protein
VQKYDLNQEIEAIDAEINSKLSITGNESATYKFKVNYSLEKSTKGEANFVFTTTNLSGDVHQVLVDKVASDELWPYKPSRVVELVKARGSSEFTSHHHTLAWKKWGIRPSNGSDKPNSCNKKYCTYHSAHHDYTYSEAWVQMLVEIVVDQEQFEKLRKFKPNG